MAIRAPRTRIPDAFAQLAEANRLKRERDDEKKINAGRLAGTVLAAGVGAMVGLPPQAVFAAANVGGQVGGAVRGGRLDPLALAQGGASIFNILDQEAETEEAARPKQSAPQLYEERAAVAGYDR